MCKKLKNIPLYLIILFFIMLFSQKANAQILYYPANAFSTIGTPSTLISPPAPTLPGILPYNLYYPFGQPPGIPVFPPAPISSLSLTAPTFSPLTVYNTTFPTTIGSIFPTSYFSPIVSASGTIFFYPSASLYTPII